MVYKPKKVLMTLRRAPYGSIYVQEAVEVAYVLASYEFDLSVVFLDDGVFSLMANQAPATLGMNSVAQAIRQFHEWGVMNVYVDRRSIEERQLSISQLISIGSDDSGKSSQPQILDSAQIAEMMASQDGIVSF